MRVLSYSGRRKKSSRQLIPTRKTIRFCEGLLFCLMALVGAMASGHAQDVPAPATAPVTPPLTTPATPANGITFLELFTSESCTFCPAAERNFNDITADEGIVGITCVVDYFDSGKPGNLSRPFCKDQQDVYVHMLRTGARYTPQLVINGSTQVQGQNLQKVSTAIQAARESKDRPLALSVSAGTEKGSYDVVLPAMPDKAGHFVLRTTMVKHAPDLATLADNDQHREHTPHNTAVALIEGGIWDGKKTIWTAKLPADTSSDGFIVTVQDQNSGRVMAAGEYNLAQ